MPVVIESWEDLQKNVNAIAAALNSDSHQAFAAATNPLFALEELGFELSPDIKDFVEDKLRFDAKRVAKLKSLRKTIFDIAGRRFNIRSDDELNDILFLDLKVIVYDDKGCPVRRRIPATRHAETDELNFYKDVHPIIEPLLKFREIDSTKPSFSGRKTYTKLRSGQANLNSKFSLTVRLKKN
jgi:DNA polymerase I-like protein with 3'-5' exonuclease and polymerase domains